MTLAEIANFICFYMVVGIFYGSFVLEARENSPDYDLVRIKRHLIRTRSKHQIIFFAKITVLWFPHFLRKLWRIYKNSKVRIHEY